MITIKTTSWERDNHIATVQASSPMRDYSLLITGSSGVDEDRFVGRCPSRQGAEAGTSAPELGVSMVAELCQVSGKILWG